MAATYLLPCTCGNKTEVVASQAGQTVTCTCGRSLNVPALREVVKLQPVEQVLPVGKRSWDTHHRLMLIGAVLVIGSLLAGAWAVFSRIEVAKVLPVSDIADQIQRATPAETWNAWEFLQRGIRRPLSPEEYQVRHYAGEYRMELRLIGGVGAIGALLLVIGGALAFTGRR